MTGHPAVECLQCWAHHASVKCDHGEPENSPHRIRRRGRVDFMEDEKRAAATIDGALELLPRLLYVLQQVEWNGQCDGHKDYNVHCPCCQACVNANTGLADIEEDEDEGPAWVHADSCQLFDVLERAQKLGLRDEEFTV